MATRGTVRTQTGPKEPRDPCAREGPEPPPETVSEALARARQHGRAAAAEGLAMARALVEATSLAASGQPSEVSRILGPLAKILEALGDELGHEAGDGSPRILDSIAEAVDEEILFWEKRARDDTEARTVLRAFLGLREILWEFGVRRAGDAKGAHRDEPPPPPSRRKSARSPGARVQRVSIEG